MKSRRICRCRIWGMRVRLRRRVAGDYIVPYRSPKGDYRDFQDFEGSIGLGDYRDLGGVYRVENETKQS